MKLPLPAGLLAAGLLLSACASGTPSASHPGQQPRPSEAATTPSRATSAPAPSLTSAAASDPAPTSAPPSAPSDAGTTKAATRPTAVSSSADPGPDAADTAETWADDLFAGKSAAACALMDGAATQQLIGYAQQVDPSVRNCGDAALALFQQADMQGTAYAKATAKATEEAATSVAFTLNYTEGRKPEKVTVKMEGPGWLVTDYQPAS